MPHWPHLPTEPLDLPATRGSPNSVAPSNIIANLNSYIKNAFINGPGGTSGRSGDGGGGGGGGGGWNPGSNQTPDPSSEEEQPLDEVVVEGERPQEPPDQNRINLCYATAVSFGDKTGTIAGLTVAGAQRGPLGALGGLSLGLAVAGASDYFDEPGPWALLDGTASTVLDGPAGFVGSQYDAMVRLLFRDQPGLAYPLGGAVGNTVGYMLRNRAIAGAGRAARWGLGAGAAYLAGYIGGFSLAYNQGIGS
ncbi:MAG: hypothetical protein AMXMBFR37_03500 [Steroidobacteraceae bacterium]